MRAKQGYTHAQAHVLEHPRAHIHTQICNTYCFSTSTMIGERASLLRYRYIVCLVISTETLVCNTGLANFHHFTTSILHFSGQVLRLCGVYKLFFSRTF